MARKTAEEKIDKVAKAMGCVYFGRHFWRDGMVMHTFQKDTPQDHLRELRKLARVIQEVCSE